VILNGISDVDSTASFEIGFTMLNGWLTQEGIIWPRKYFHFPCLIRDRLLYGSASHLLDTL
jgi:hypothetical protein